MKVVSSPSSVVRKSGFCSTLSALLLALCVFAEAQQPAKVHKVGILLPTSASAVSEWLGAFQRGLEELGYVEGKNIVYESRYADGNFNKLPDLAVELVRLKVDVVLTASTPGVLAAKNASSTIPIVMASAGDPVASGLVRSLAHPGGNVTGLTQMSRPLGGKRLEILKEAVPKLSRVAVLRNGTNPSHLLLFREMEAAAKSLDLRLQPVESTNAHGLESAFAAIRNARAGAVVPLADPVFLTRRTEIVSFAAKSRLPSIYEDREFSEAGGLMSYSASRTDLFRRAAVYVDKILKGTKPADLPVEQPTKFEFVINLKTAKQIGLTIPPNVLARADRVIR
jgi:putative ABC transport system substrate-binding protein